MPSHLGMPRHWPRGMPGPTPHQSWGARRAEHWGCNSPAWRYSPGVGSPMATANEVPPPACLCQSMGTGAMPCHPCTPVAPQGDPRGPPARSWDSQSTSQKLARNERKRHGGSRASGRAGTPQVSRLGATLSMGAAPLSGGSICPAGPSASVCCVRVRACMRVRRRRAAIPWWWSVSAGVPCC